VGKYVLLFQISVQVSHFGDQVQEISVSSRISHQLLKDINQKIVNLLYLFMKVKKNTFN